MTIEELLRLPEGTKVKIKNSVDCHEKYKEGGFVTIGNNKIEAEEGGYDYSDDGYYFGINVPDFGSCYMFHINDYELA